VPLQHEELQIMPEGMQQVIIDQPIIHQGPEEEVNRFGPAIEILIGT